VEHLAGLARVAISDDEKKILQHDLEEILTYVSQVKEVEYEKSKIENGELRNVMRADENPHEAGMFTEDLLNSAPKRAGAHIVVKKIL
jgi:aspartyl-tRNA(Asn)/glutamyl-tRNA(Gln) amidotransferase subunit C